MKKYLKYISLMLLFLSMTIVFVSCKDAVDPVVYQVSYETNCDLEYDTVSVEEGKFVTPPSNPYKTGFVFNGWFLDSTFKSQWLFDVHTVSSDITLYANWLKQEHRITYSATNLVSDGYVIETNKSVVFYDEEAQFTVTVFDGVISTVVVKAASTTLNYYNQEMVANGVKYYYKIENVRTNLTLRVENVQFKTSAIYVVNEDPYFTVVGVDFLKTAVPFGADYKFYVDLSTSHSRSIVRPVYGGQNLMGENEEIDGQIKKVFTVPNVRQNVYITIEDVSRNLYSVSLPVSDKFTITGNANVLHGTGYQFTVKLNDSYSVMGLDNLSVLVGGETRAFTSTYNSTTKEYTVTLSAVTGDVDVLLDTTQWQINSYDVVFPETQVGYTITSATHTSSNNTYAVGYGENCEMQFVLLQNFSRSDFDIKVNNISITHLMQDWAGGKRYILQNVTQHIQVDVLGVEENFFTLSLAAGSVGVVLEGVDGSLKILESGDRSISFRVNLLTGYRISDGGLVVKMGDTFLTPTNGIYQLLNVTENISLTVEGVEKQSYSVELPSALGASVSGDKTSVLFDEQLKITFEINEAYLQSLSTVRLLYNGVNLPREIVGNSVVFTVANVTKNVTTEDFSVTGLDKNRYSVTFPETENYTIDGADYAVHGEEYVLTLTTSAAFNLTTLALMINGVEYAGANQIVLDGSVTVSNIVITQKSAVSKFVYAVKFYASSSDGITGLFENYEDDGYTEITFETEAEHGDAFPTPEILPTAPTGYEFKGWKNLPSTVTANSEIYAEFEIISYRLTLVLNGGELAESVINFTHLTKPDLTTLVPTKTNYTFEGWYSDIEKTVKVTELTLSTQTLYANYVIRVGAGKNFSTLSSAITAAQENDIIMVDSGTFSAGAFIYKNLKIIGSDTTVFDMTAQADLQYKFYNNFYCAFLIYPIDAYGQLSGGGTVNLALENITIKVKNQQGYLGLCSENANLTLNNVVIIGGDTSVVKGKAAHTFSATNSLFENSLNASNALYLAAGENNFSANITDSEFVLNGENSNAIKLGDGLRKVKVSVNNNTFAGSGQNNFVLNSNGAQNIVGFNENNISAAYLKGINLFNYTAQVLDTTQIENVKNMFVDNYFESENFIVSLSTQYTAVIISYGEFEIIRVNVLSKSALTNASLSANFDIYLVSAVSLESAENLTLSAGKTLHLNALLINHGTITNYGTIYSNDNLENHGQLINEDGGVIYNEHGFVIEQLTLGVDSRFVTAEKKSDTTFNLLSGEVINVAADAEVLALFGANTSKTFIAFKIYVGLTRAGELAAMTLTNEGGLLYSNGTHTKEASDYISIYGYLHFIIDTNYAQLTKLTVEENGVVYEIFCDLDLYENAEPLLMGSDDYWGVDQQFLLLEKDELEYYISGIVKKSFAEMPATIYMRGMDYAVVLDLYVGIQFWGKQFAVKTTALKIDTLTTLLQEVYTVNNSGYINYIYRFEKLDEVVITTKLDIEIVNHIDGGSGYYHINFEEISLDVYDGKLAMAGNTNNLGIYMGMIALDDFSVGSLNIFKFSGSVVEVSADAAVLALYGGTTTAHFVTGRIFVGLEHAGKDVLLVLTNDGGLTYSTGTHTREAWDKISPNGYIEFIVDVNVSGGEINLTQLQINYNLDDEENEVLFTFSDLTIFSISNSQRVNKSAPVANYNVNNLNYSVNFVGFDQTEDALEYEYEIGGKVHFNDDALALYGDTSTHYLITLGVFVGYQHIGKTIEVSVSDIGGINGIISGNYTVTKNGRLEFLVDCNYIDGVCGLENLNISYQLFGVEHSFDFAVSVTAY